MKTPLLVLVLVLNGWVVSAQTLCELNCTAGMNEPFTIVTDAAACAKGCALKVDGAVRAVPRLLTATTAEFAFAGGIGTGVHAFEVVDGAGVSVSDPNTL